MDDCWLPEPVILTVARVEAAKSLQLQSAADGATALANCRAEEVPGTGVTSSSMRQDITQFAAVMTLEGSSKFASPEKGIWPVCNALHRLLTAWPRSVVEGPGDAEKTWRRDTRGAAPAAAGEAAADWPMKLPADTAYVSTRPDSVTE